MCFPSSPFSIENDSVSIAANQRVSAELDGPSNQLNIKSLVVFNLINYERLGFLPFFNCILGSLGLSPASKFLEYYAVSEKATLGRFFGMEVCNDSVPQSHYSYGINRKFSGIVSACEGTIYDFSFRLKGAGLGIQIGLKEFCRSISPIVNCERCQAFLPTMLSSYAYRFLSNGVGFPNSHLTTRSEMVTSASRRDKNSIVFKCHKLTIVVFVRTEFVRHTTIGGEYNFVLHNVNESDSSLQRGFDAGMCICTQQKTRNNELSGFVHMILVSDGNSRVENSGSISEVYGQGVFISKTPHHWKELTLSLAEIQGALPQTGIETALVRGGFPQLYANLDIDPVAFYNSYIATYLERDVRSLTNVSSLRDFERFLRALALRSANLLNKADLALDVGIAPSTANHWLSMLEASGQIVLLEPWFSNRTKSIVKSPKLISLHSSSGPLAWTLTLRWPMHGWE